MYKLLVLLLIFLHSTMLFGAYEVKIGVYKNGKNLRKNIAKIQPTKYRNYIKITKKKNLNYVHAIIEGNKEARNALRAYKRVFKDAFISKNHVAIKKKKQRKKFNPLYTKKVSSTKKEKTKAKLQVKEPSKTVKINAKELLTEKTIYLCYEKGPTHLKERVVEMVFEKEYVIYNPLKKMSKPVKMPYSFNENNLTLELSGMKITHDVYKKDVQFLYAKSVIDGLVVNKLRYYFDKRAALAYIGKE